MLLVIDNYDSFTYNLVHYFQVLKQDVRTYKNDEISLSQISALQPSHIVFSPGPGRPESAGITLNCIEEFAGKIPLLGVCLGHQAIAKAFGATITNASEIIHGKTSEIAHNNQGVFKNLPNPMTATRYHSLVIDPQTLTDEFVITAWCQDKNSPTQEIMGIKHRSLPIEGVQFHPESILTESGSALLANFIRQT